MNMHISLNTILNDIHAVRAGLSTITKKKSKQNAIQTVRIVCLFHTFLDFCTLVDFPIPAFPACTSLDLVDCDKKTGNCMSQIHIACYFWSLPV